MSSIKYSSFKQNWLEQFNLYKYQSAKTETELKHERLRRDKFVILSILGMISLILSIISVVAVLARSSPVFENDVYIGEELNASKISDDIDNFVVPKIEIMTNLNQTTTEHPPSHRPLKPPLIRENREHVKFFDEIPSNQSINEYLLEREDVQPRYDARQRQQKVKFLIHPRHRYRQISSAITAPTIRNQIPRPPNYNHFTMNRRHQFDYHDDDEAEEEPRPFNFAHNGVEPSEFQKENCTRGLDSSPLLHDENQINNIQDILREVDSPTIRNQKSLAGIKIAGSYRHPKGKNMAAILSRIARRQNHEIQGTKLSEHYYTNPLNSYKPRSPGEINMLALNQFKFPHPKTKLKLLHQPKHYQPQHSDNVENIYQNVIEANKMRQLQLDTSRTSKSNPKHKPFSLMLDIYPMPEDEPSTHRPYKTKLRKPYLPLPQGPGAVNNLPYSYQLGNSYYNSMHFPQIQQHKHPQSNKFYENTYLRNQYRDQNDIYQREFYSRNPSDGSDNKPSQIMVHLNLFPKHKFRQLERSSNFPSSGYSYNDTIETPSSSIATPAATPSITNENNIRFEEPIVVSAEEDFFPRPNSIHNYSNRVIQPRKIEPEMAFGSTDFQLPKDSILKFQYNDAVTTESDKS